MVWVHFFESDIIQLRRKETRENRHEPRNAPAQSLRLPRNIIHADSIKMSGNYILFFVSLQLAMSIMNNFRHMIHRKVSKTIYIS